MEIKKSVMKKVVALITIPILIGVLIGGCSTYRFPGVHRITIQQGNVVTQTMVNKLKPGMTKSQVHYVLGTPVVQDPLNNTRWVYIYTIQIPGNDEIQKKLQIHFVDERLSHFDGNYGLTENTPAESDQTEDSTPSDG
ncbi:MAG: outer membrane protein assembly factor BamE [Flavobacterium sp.]|jgi:outer membrane protein assembly factor BamE